MSKTEMAIFVFFTLEYFVRIIFKDFDKNPEHRHPLLRYVFVWGAIDLIVLIAYWIPAICSCSLSALRIFRILRMFRLAKLQRYGDPYKKLKSIVLKRRNDLIFSAIYLAIVLFAASLLMYAAEHEVQPDKFKSACSGLWWAVTTFTTVGYGDITPVTLIGRFWGGIIGLIGICSLAVLTGIVTSVFVGIATVNDLAKQGRGLSEYDREQDGRINELSKKIEELSKASIETQCKEISRAFQEKMGELTVSKEFRQEVARLTDCVKEQGEMIRELSSQVREVSSKFKDESTNRSKVSDGAFSSILSRIFQR